MKYSVFVTFAIEGFHCWPEAKDVFPEVGFCLKGTDICFILNVMPT